MSGKSDELRRELLSELRILFRDSELSYGDQIVILEIVKDELMNQYEDVHDLEFVDEDVD